MKLLSILFSTIALIAVFVLSMNNSRGVIQPLAHVNQSETITYNNGVTRNETEVSYNGRILVIQTDRLYHTGDTLRFENQPVLCAGVNCTVESPVVVNQVNMIAAYAHTYDRPIHNMRHISTVYGPQSYVYVIGSMWNDAK